MSAQLACSLETVDLTKTLDKNFLESASDLGCFALEQEMVDGEWEITLVFTSDAHIAELHAEFMGIPDPTDIMTFPTDDVLGGDIVISIDRAEIQRHDDGWDLPSELRFLVAHGVLHLAGWDDSTAEEREKMLDRQREIIIAFQAEPLSSKR